MECEEEQPRDWPGTDWNDNARGSWREAVEKAVRGGLEDQGRQVSGYR